MTVTGKQLIQKLKATGTGNDKLDIAREVIITDPKATADAVVKTLEKAGIGEATLAKARMIAATGEYTAPAFNNRNVEDEPDGGGDPLPPPEASKTTSELAGPANPPSFQSDPIPKDTVVKPVPNHGQQPGPITNPGPTGLTQVSKVTDLGQKQGHR